MEQAALDNLQQLIEDEIKTRFPGAAIERVRILQYGDDPVVEPGELAVRVFLAAAEGGGEEERKQVLDDFHRAFEKELHRFREDLSGKLPEARRLEFSVGEDKH